MLGYHLEHIFSYTARLAAPPEVIGPVPGGIRINFYVQEGEATGPQIRGKVRPVGGDWFTLRPDGVGLLDVRATIETDDGALIDVAYRGMIDLGSDAYDRFLRGQPLSSGPGQLRTQPRFLSSAPAYAWLNRLFCLGIGLNDPEKGELLYDVYAVR